MREFVMLPEFDKQWKAMGFSDKDLKALQEELTLDPGKGVLMRGQAVCAKSESLTKARDKAAAYERIYLITAYSKSEKDNLSKEKRNTIKSLIRILDGTMK